MTTTDRIKAEIERLGWTRKDLANRAGVPEQTVYAWLARDSQRMDVAQLSRVADCLGLTLDWLIAGKTPKRRRK
jgi:transcriptional regulator with XRE-family HTH domain